MDTNEYYAWVPPAPPPAPRRERQRWLRRAGVVLALMLTLGAGVVLGTAIRNAQAAGLSLGASPNALVLTGPYASGPAQGRCAVLTVASVSGQTITATGSNGSMVTIHTSSATQYTRAGQTIAASTIAKGTQIQVHGTSNNDGSITATSITVVG